MDLISPTDVYNIIKQADRTIQLVHVTDGAYVPGTGKTQTTSTYNLLGLIINSVDMMASDDRIVEDGKRRCIIQALNIPKVPLKKDFIIDPNNNLQYQITDVHPIYCGTSVLYYQLDIQS
jgi:hypothetical protein